MQITFVLVHAYDTDVGLYLPTYGDEFFMEAKKERLSLKILTLAYIFSLLGSVHKLCRLKIGNF